LVLSFLCIESQGLDVSSHLMDSSFDLIELVVDLLSIFLVLFDKLENFILLLLDGLKFINVSLLYGVVISGLHSLVDLLEFHLEHINS
jgi:hypothetical protein